MGAETAGVERAEATVGAGRVGAKAAAGRGAETAGVERAEATVAPPMFASRLSRSGSTAVAATAAAATVAATVVATAVAATVVATESGSLHFDIWLASLAFFHRCNCRF
jgi:hypothetical protein